MKKKCFRVFAVILAAVLICLVPGTNVTEVKAADSLEFEKKKYTLYEGNYDTLWVTYNGEEHFQPSWWDTYGEVTYSSSKPEVATVNSWGEITCLKSGTVTITAKYNGVTAKCKVKVKKCPYKLSVDEAKVYTNQPLEVKMTGQKNISYYGSDFVVDEGSWPTMSIETSNDGTFTIKSSTAGKFTIYFYAYKKNGKRMSKSFKLTVEAAGFAKTSYTVAQDCAVTIKPDNAKLKSMEVISWRNNDENTNFDKDSDPQYWKGYWWDDDDYDYDDEEWDEDEFRRNYDGIVPDDIGEYYYDWDYCWNWYEYDSWDDFLDYKFTEGYWTEKFWDSLEDIYSEEDFWYYVYFEDEYWESWENEYYSNYWNEYYWWFDSSEEYEAFKRENYSSYVESVTSAKAAHKAEMDAIVSGYMSNMSYYIDAEKNAYKSEHWEDALEWESKHSEFLTLKSKYDAELQKYNTARDAAKAKFEAEKKEKEAAKNQEKQKKAATLEESYPFTVSNKGELKGFADGYGEVRACYTVSSGEEITVTLDITVTNPTELNFTDSLWVRDGFFRVSATGADWDSSYSIKSADESIVSTDPPKNKNTSGYNSYSNYYDYYDSYYSECYVFPQKEGKVTLTVTVDGKKFTKEVNVIDPKIPDGNLILVNKKKKNRAVTNLPEDMKVTYTSSDKSVVTISKKGIVKAKADGSANICVKVGDREFNYSVIVGFNLPTLAVAKATEVVGAKYSQDKRMQEGYYDCSSLVWRSYNAAGVALGSESYAPTAANLAKFMEDNGYVISYKALDAEKMKPGDIIFSSSTNNGRYMNIDHVSLYMGNTVDNNGNVTGGKVVQAGSPGVYISEYLYSYPQSDLIVMIARLG